MEPFEVSKRLSLKGKGVPNSLKTLRKLQVVERQFACHSQLLMGCCADTNCSYAIIARIFKIHNLLLLARGSVPTFHAPAHCRVGVHFFSRRTEDPLKGNCASHHSSSWTDVMSQREEAEDTWTSARLTPQTHCSAFLRHLKELENLSHGETRNFAWDMKEMETCLMDSRPLTVINLQNTVSRNPGPWSKVPLTNSRISATFPSRFPEWACASLM